MSKPSNPFEIVIKNKFFPEGLTELEIYNYWMKKKIELLTYLRSKRVIFYLTAENGKTIVRRYENKEQKPQHLNDQNYEKKITGRTVGILEVFDDVSNFGVIDIDSPKESDEISSESAFNLVKDLTSEVFKYFTRLYECSILYTGKNGFHVRCQFNSKMNMRRIKETLEDHIKSIENLKHFLGSRTDSRPNIDLSSNMKNGAVIVEHSLNKIGIPAVELSLKNLRDFKRESLIGEIK